MSAMPPLFGIPYQQPRIRIVGSSYSSHSAKVADRGISHTTVHPHSDVGCSLAATFDASSSSETASSHISGYGELFSSKKLTVLNSICTAAF